MIYQTYITNENNEVVEKSDMRIICSCCGKDVTDDEEGYFGTDFFKNHTTNEKIVFPVLCNSCTRCTFRW